MKAYLTRSYGPEARLEAAEIPVPEPASGQILIEVKATSLNPIDNMFLRQDMGFNPELPAALHGDVAGVVSAVGQGVDRFKSGDEVYACAGGFKGHGGACSRPGLGDGVGELACFLESTSGGINGINGIYYRVKLLTRLLCSPRPTG